MSVPSRVARGGTRGYAHLVEIAVPVTRVWLALTDPQLVSIWWAPDAQIDARAGGYYRFGKQRMGGREAHIDVFDPNRRLRLIYLNDPDQPPGATALVDDFLLDVRRSEGLVALRLLGSGIPEAKTWDKPYVRMRLTWEKALARLKRTLESPPSPKPVRAPPKEPPLPGLDF